MKANFCSRLISIGKSSGCHQIPARSFHINKHQLPICARCTGVLVGNILAYVVFLSYSLPLRFCIIGCAVMFIDWFIQYLNICVSTNIRRLITGIIGGYSLTTLYCIAIKYVVQLIVKSLTR